MSPIAAQRKASVMPEREPFAAFVCDDVTAAVVSRAAGERGWDDVPVLEGGITEALSILPTIPTPHLLVIDLSESPDPLEDIHRLALVCDSDTRVVAIGGVNDIGLYRALVEIGVDDYLLKPLTLEDLSAAIARTSETPVAAVPVVSEEREGRLTTVIGARGGAGATSIAVNAAWQIANEQDLRVALVDLDLYFGTVALSLDIEPGRGFGEAISSPNRIDGLFMERAMVRANDNLFVLGSERTLDQVPHLGPEAIDPLLTRLRSDFDCIVVDLPRRTAVTVPGLIAASQSVVLVSDLSLAGMRDTLRLIEFIRSVAPQTSIRLVANRIGQAKRGELAKDEFERHIEREITIAIPDEVKAAEKSATHGKPIAAVAPKGRFATLLRPLSRELSGVATAEKTGLWRRLVGKSS